VLIDMVRAIFGTPDIDDKHREMIILRAATVLDVPYEWQANKVMAENAGLTETDIQAAAGDRPVSGIASDYVLICAATDELLRTGITDADRPLIRPPGYQSTDYSRRSST
jgi:carboxymuconolactone decarboxylase family protein